MMADLVSGVRDQFAAQGLDVDVYDGAEYPARELYAVDADGNPKPRVVFIENGLDGNVRDTFGASIGPSFRVGPPLPRMAREAFCRNQGVEVRVWSFDPSKDENGMPNATPLQHRAAVNRLVNHVDGTGVLPALYGVLGFSKEAWEIVGGGFDNDGKEIKYGATYVLTFRLPVPVIVQLAKVATPRPAPTTQLVTNGSTDVGCSS